MISEIMRFINLMIKRYWNHSELIIDTIATRSLITKRSELNLSPHQELISLSFIARSIILKKEIERTIILNGMSSMGYSLSLVSKLLKKRTLFWENGLLNNSIILDSLGVNSFSSLRLNVKNNFRYHSRKK